MTSKLQALKSKVLADEEVKEAYDELEPEFEVVEKSVGVIDSYRIKYRSERKHAIGTIIREMIVGDEVQAKLEQFCIENQIDNADKFIAIATVELDKLHTGAIVSLGVTEKMFLAWKEKTKASGFTPKP